MTGCFARYFSAAVLVLYAVPAVALCAAPPEDGRWTNRDRGGSPYALEVRMTDCENPSGGSPYRVVTWARRGDGTLYQRAAVKAEYRTVDGRRWLAAAVNVGGYVDRLLIRRANVQGPKQLVVRVHSDSLDSKPDSHAEYRFESGLVPPAAQPPAMGRTGGVLVPVPSTGPSPFGASYFVFGLVDWDKDGHTDLIARDGANDLWLYPGESKRGYSTTARVKIGNGWAGYTSFGAVDWDKDGNPDLIARDGSGDLWLFPGEGKRGYSAAGRVKIGNGWGAFIHAGTVDWDSDGNPDILAIDGNGDLWLYAGEGKRAYSSAGRFQVGNGWGSYTSFGAGDWDRDGSADIIGRDTAGDLWLYPGESKRGYSATDRVRIGNGWGGYTPFGIADWDADRSADIVARNTSRDLMLFPGQSTRGYSAVQPVKIGNGW